MGFYRRENTQPHACPPEDSYNLSKVNKTSYSGFRWYANYKQYVARRGVFDLGRVGCSSDEGEKRKRREISACIEDPQVIEIIPHPSTTARLIA